MVTGSPTACGDTGAGWNVLVLSVQARVWSKISSPRVSKGVLPSLLSVRKEGEAAVTDPRLRDRQAQGGLSICT